MSRNVLVIGRGKPHHITEALASEWVLKGKAIWQKQGRRIKYTRGKRKRPPVARTIDATAIQNAYVEGKVYERERIESYKEAGSMKERSQLRRRAGLTQAELARRTGIHAPLLCMWERHQIEFPPEKVALIQNVLCVELTHWLRSLDSETAAHAA